MTSILQTVYAPPLEREYEAWIVAAIEQYFLQTNRRFAIWAVSPEYEVAWPADEYLFADSKLVGLQFKQAKLANYTNPGFNRLYWVLHQPLGQFELIQRTPEIFYCLPTFINRNFRAVALDHCLFWRPDDRINKNLWYDNRNSRSPYNNIKTADRWGSFLESVLACSIGKRVKSQKEAASYVRTLYNKARNLQQQRADQQQNDLLQHDPQQADSGFYLLAIEL